MLEFYPHQIKILNDTYEYDNVAYYVDMGLGKTFLASEKLWQLNQPYNLVICQKSKIEDWAHHFKAYYPEYHVVIYDNQSISKLSDNTILIINYERAWRRPVLNKLKDYTLILDESSMIKNDRSNQSQFILSLKPNHVILLSGTPIAGKYEEIWSQMRLLGWGIKKTTFLKQFTDGKFNKKFMRYEIKGYKNIDRLKSKLKNYGAIFLKTEEVFDLPQVTDQVISVENTKEYRGFKKSEIIEIDGNLLVGDLVTKKLLYLRQLAGVYNTNKVSALKDILNSTQDRLIIFYNFKIEFELLKQVSDRPLSIINGDTKDLSNYDTYNNSMTLVQYQAGAMGVNLQKANKIIYFTPTVRSDLFEQSKKRIHRIGQDRPCFYYHLITKGTIERDIQQSLEQKKDFTDSLFKKNR